ncbi:hypothetical protein COT77_02710 [Candidatus Berkelbacteria bacterium CG10_big_fil_rev_8_21_14_0_10_41_12]|uniref:DAGKc domain-containing protein n=1 Tax=Candidatus Berkelbacteria bacterium CG10_big_fil_rev_8_21_14_0_10_41_12 TaxID=1974513 RepID=A0A2M6WWP3_9BACT|nr:MAG: hypothetical protein COT77_02710 [Candidatus Berkelbacteria bacterium CG10_big_fil_rev_8_21_14_0_10_41_12]
MYYYIFESPKNSRERQLFEKIRDVARTFGIAGEITQSSPARTPDELTKMGLEKNYSTIIAIGTNSHINKIITRIMKEKPEYPVAIGLIPTDPTSSLSKNWSYKSVEEACETLKYRKVEKLNVGLIDPGRFFLTSAYIFSRKPIKFYLDVDRWQAEATANLIQIFSNLTVEVEKFDFEGSKLKAAINWLVGKSNEKVERSIFRGKTVKVSSDKVLPVYVDNEIVARTPISVYRKLKVLNVIMKRDKVLPDKTHDAEDQSGERN